MSFHFPWTVDWMNISMDSPYFTADGGFNLRPPGFPSSGLIPDTAVVPQGLGYQSWKVHPDSVIG